jgi:hypothetical protein
MPEGQGMQAAVTDWEEMPEPERIEIDLGSKETAVDNSMMRNVAVELGGAEAVAEDQKALHFRKGQASDQHEDWC